MVVPTVPPDNGCEVEVPLVTAMPSTAGEKSPQSSTMTLTVAGSDERPVLSAATTLSS